MTGSRSNDLPDKLDFTELYKSCLDDVYAYVESFLQDRAAAEDVTAQAFERAYKRRWSYRPKRGSARSWLFGIARNAALDELRKRKRRATLVTDPADPLAVGTRSQAEDALTHQSVRDALRKISPREREIVSLKFGGGLSNREIAQVLGTSESNAGTQLYRAMTKLRRLCDETA